jgi:hypothetical protein
MSNKQQFAIKALERIKAIQDNYRKLRKLGVDLMEYEDGVGLLEEAVALLLCEDEKYFDNALNTVQWWLYEDVEKVITLKDQTKVDVTSAPAFVSWLDEWYKMSHI